MIYYVLCIVSGVVVGIAIALIVVVERESYRPTLTKLLALQDKEIRLRIAMTSEPTLATRIALVTVRKKLRHHARRAVAVRERVARIEQIKLYVKVSRRWLAPRTKVPTQLLTPNRTKSQEGFS